MRRRESGHGNPHGGKMCISRRRRACAFVITIAEDGGRREDDAERETDRGG